MDPQNKDEANDVPLKFAPLRSVMQITPYSQLSAYIAGIIPEFEWQAQEWKWKLYSPYAWYWNQGMTGLGPEPFTEKQSLKLIIGHEIPPKLRGRDGANLPKEGQKAAFIQWQCQRPEFTIFVLEHIMPHLQSPLRSRYYARFEKITYYFFDMETLLNLKDKVEKVDLTDKDELLRELVQMRVVVTFPPEGKPITKDCIKVEGDPCLPARWILKEHKSSSDGTDMPPEYSSISELQQQVDRDCHRIFVSQHHVYTTNWGTGLACVNRNLLKFRRWNYWNLVKEVERLQTAREEQQAREEQWPVDEPSVEQTANADITMLDSR